MRSSERKVSFSRFAKSMSSSHDFAEVFQGLVLCEINAFDFCPVGVPFRILHVDNYREIRNTDGKKRG